LRGGRKLSIFVKDMDLSYYKTSSGREPVRDYICKLPEKDRAFIEGDFKLIQKHGLEAPVVFRHLKGKLWEIKTGRGHQQRIFYCVLTGPLMLLLHACKKQKQGSQHEDVSVAYYRMQEVLK
jgi:phage-related protein